MKFLDINGLKRLLANLLTKMADVFDTLEARVTKVEGDYLSKSDGGTVEGTLKTDDVQVGQWSGGLPVEDIDPATNKNKAAGSLRVNGTTELAGEIKTHGQDVDFGNVNASNGIRVGGSAHLPETFLSGNLDMGGQNMNNCQSISVIGTVRGNTYKAPKLDATNASGTRIGKETEPYKDIYAENIHGDLDGNAASADKLTANAGAVDKPVYFSEGKPVECDFAAVTAEDIAAVVAVVKEV